MREDDDEEALASWRATEPLEVDLDLEPPRSASRLASLRPALSSPPEPEGARTLAAPISEGEVAMAAGYGPAPTHWVETPAYAVRVWRRRRALREGLALRGQTVAAAEVGLGRRARELFDAVAKRHPQAVAGLRERLSSLDEDVIAVRTDLAREDVAAAAQHVSETQRQRRWERVSAQARRDEQLAQLLAAEAQRRAVEGAADGVRPPAAGLAAAGAPGTPTPSRPPRSKMVRTRGPRVVTGGGEASPLAAVREDARCDASLRALEAVLDQAPELLRPDERVRGEALRATRRRLEREHVVDRLAVDAYDHVAFRYGVVIIALNGLAAVALALQLGC
ncbi:MAG: hypothetical protein AAF715_09300 [Myxococcota bacterium]